MDKKSTYDAKRDETSQEYATPVLTKHGRLVDVTKALSTSGHPKHPNHHKKEH